MPAKMQQLLFILAVLVVGISSAVEFDEHKPFVKNVSVPESVILDQITDTLYIKILSSLGGIKKLVINDSNLDRIEDGALCALPFEEIDIRSSQVPELTAASFGTCPSLKKLTYTNTFTDRPIFADDVFRGVENLEEVSTFYLTRIDRVPDVRNLTKLKKLQLTFASIEHIDEDAFDGTGNVEELDLRGNKFVEFDGKFLKNLGKLRTLMVGASNDLIGFAWDDLVHVPNLERLDINFSNVKRIEARKLLKFCPKLREFNFQENDISCEAIREVIKIFHRKKPEVEMLNYKCLVSTDK